MKKLLILFLLLTLSGCSGIELSSGDDLLQAPKPPSDYLALQNEIDKTLATGAVYAVIESGTNRNSVQLIDLDADGEEEAVAIFRESKSSGNFVVKIYRKSDEQYVEVGSIDGIGTSVYSIEYPVFSAIGAKGIVISWKVGTETEKGVTVAKEIEGSFYTVLDTLYLEYVLTDTNYNGVQELITISYDENNKNYKKAKLYQNTDTGLNSVFESSLSYQGDSIRSVTATSIDHITSAIYVESRIAEGTGMVTDILVINPDSMVNIAVGNIDENALTFRNVNVFCEDVDGDGLLEVPSARIFTDFDEDSEEVYYMYDWYSYNINESPTLEITNYRNSNEGWQLTVNEDWQNYVSITKSVENNNNITDFIYMQGDEILVLAEIAVYTGDSRYYYAEQAGTVTLAETTAAVYCVIIPEDASSSKYALTASEIAENFSLIS